MTTTRLPLFLDSAHRNAAEKRHPRLWKIFIALCAEETELNDLNDPHNDVFHSIQDQKDELLKKMGLD
jgi:hypothetical protein